MSVADDIAALRTGIALSSAGHLSCVRVGGKSAHDLLDRVSPRPLFARQGQMIHTLFLDDAARPLADVYVCSDEDDFIVIADGMTGAQVISYIEPYTLGLDATLSDLTATHAMLALDGPYAWELLAEVTAPDVIGLGYLTFFSTGRFTCLRAGKTGEYGYLLLVERAELPALRRELVATGAKLGVREISLEALDLCQLEAGFFNVRREVRDGITPVELQQQWRTSRDRTYPGSAALTRSIAAAHRRTVLAVSGAPIQTDAEVTHDGAVIGKVLHAGPSFTRGGYIALLLVDIALAHPGVSDLDAAGATMRTVSSPATNNRSIYIDPQQHSWATRERTAFPPLVRPAWS